MSTNGARAIFRSIWVWVLLLACACLLAYLMSRYQTDADEFILYADEQYFPSEHALVTNGKVEVEGGMVDLSASQGGTFKSVYVKEGDTVRAGQVLAEQENRDEIIGIRNAEIDAENAEIQLERDKVNMAMQIRNLERARTEFSQRAIAEADLERAEDQLMQAELGLVMSRNNLEKVTAQLETAKLKLAGRKLISPVDGQILQTAVNAGSGVSASNLTVAFRIIPDAPRNVRVKLAERDIDKVFVGQTVSIQGEFDSETAYEGRVFSIARVFSSALEFGDNNTLDVLIAAKDLPFRLGKNVIVSFQPSDLDTTRGTGMSGTGVSGSGVSGSGVFDDS